MYANTLYSKLTHRQLLAPKLRIQLKIAELPLGALIDHVRLEAEQNPLLKSSTVDFDQRIYEALATRNTSFLKPSLSLDSNPVVLADAEIHIKKNKINVLLNGRDIPKLHINPLYRKILKDPSAPVDTKEFVKEQLKKALIFIDAINKRRETLHKLIHIIVNTQKDFLTGKSRQANPLTLSNLATKLKLHISTVSRITSQKYVLIHGETIPLRSLLISPFKKSESFSRKNLSHRISEILRDPKKQSLSDHKISKLLQEEGVPIARRTVTKYREALGIPSSFRRKSH